jgi:hypothetical protein
MTVPSHNLYDFVHQVTESRFLMFYFYPWGEKDFCAVFDYHFDMLGADCLSTVDAYKFFPKHLADRNKIRNFQPVIMCHDQEPLFFDYYTNNGAGMKKYLEIEQNIPADYLMPDQNLRSCHRHSMYKQWILLHSEKNSHELARYEDTGDYAGAFWWSHAVLARDWYRFAEHDLSLNNKSNNRRLFLVYARDTTGSRVYRQDFLSMIDDIKSQCQIGSVRVSQPGPAASATYESLDFASTEISIVLETLFEDQRIHLTEKILRPIACGHPFLLAAGAGSLEFLRSYGFKTFHPWINEDYDLEKNHSLRLKMIVKEMKRLSSLDPAQRQLILAHCTAIAEENKNHFFSADFYNQIINELKSNVDQAWQKVQGIYDSTFWLKIRRWRRKNCPEYFQDSTTLANDSYMIPLIRHLRQNRGSLEQYQRHEHCLDDKSSTNGNNV